MNPTSKLLKWPISLLVGFEVPPDIIGDFLLINACNLVQILIIFYVFIDD